MSEGMACRKASKHASTPVSLKEIGKQARRSVRGVKDKDRKKVHDDEEAVESLSDGSSDDEGTITLKHSWCYT